MSNGKQNTLTDKDIKNSADSLFSYTCFNMPYYGSTLYHPKYGSLVNVNYTKANIVLIPSKDSIPNIRDQYSLEQKLNNASLLSSLMSFVSTGAGVLQANEAFFVDGSKITKTTTDAIKTTKYQFARGIGDVGKTFGKFFSFVSIGITAGQIANEGVNENTGTDMVVCAVGFVSGVGWVISGIYTISNVVVTEVTGKTIPQHVKEPLFEMWCKFNRELENRIWNWIRTPYMY